MNARYKRGWFNESHRHYLAAKGVKTSYFKRSKVPRGLKGIYDVPYSGKYSEDNLKKMPQGEGRRYKEGIGIESRRNRLKTFLSKEFLTPEEYREYEELEGRKTGNVELDAELDLLRRRKASILRDNERDGGDVKNILPKYADELDMVLEEEEPLKAQLKALLAGEISEVNVNGVILPGLSESEMKKLAFFNRKMYVGPSSKDGSPGYKKISVRQNLSDDEIKEIERFNTDLQILRADKRRLILKNKLLKELEEKEEGLNDEQMKEYRENVAKLQVLDRKEIDMAQEVTDANMEILSRLNKDLGTDFTIRDMLTELGATEQIGGYGQAPPRAEQIKFMKMGEFGKPKTFTKLDPAVREGLKQEKREEEKIRKNDEYGILQAIDIETLKNKGISGPEKMEIGEKIVSSTPEGERKVEYVLPKRTASKVVIQDVQGKEVDEQGKPYGFEEAKMVETNVQRGIKEASEQLPGITRQQVMEELVGKVKQRQEKTKATKLAKAQLAKEARLTSEKPSMKEFAEKVAQAKRELEEARRRKNE